MRDAPTRRLHALLAEYEDLENLHDKQARGRQFNAFIAKLLEAYDIRAEPNYRYGPGEIDVAFQVKETRFILEAKWEKDPVCEDPIIKIRDRARKRLAGTVPLILSMSGYTSPALENLRLGDRLDVLLFEREHLEAMLYGLVSPDTLFPLILDKAHFAGQALTKIACLTTLRQTTKDRFRWTWPDDFAPPSLVDSCVGFNPIFATDCNIAGKKILESRRGTILVGTRDGIVAVDSRSRDVSLELGIPGAYPIQKRGEDLFVVRNGAVVQFNNSSVSFLFPLNKAHTFNASGNLWTFEKTDDGGRQLGQILDAETTICLPPQTMCYTVLPNGRIVIVRAESPTSTFHVRGASGGDFERTNAEVPEDTRQLYALSPDRVLVRSVRGLHLLDVETNKVSQMLSTTHELVDVTPSGDGGVYVALWGRQRPHTFAVGHLGVPSSSCP